MKNKLSIVLPTQNRPFYLSRALKFYSEESLPYEIHIVDSSEADKKKDVLKIVKGSPLNTIFHDYEYGVSANIKFENTLQAIESEYILMIADDDFVMPMAIFECVEFLSNNKDYSVAHGRSYRFSIGNNKRIKVKNYKQDKLDMDCPERRLIAHLNDWSTSAYSVQKTKNLRDIVGTYKKFNDDIRSMELYWYAANVIRGKVAKLDIPYMFRQNDAPKEWMVDEYSVWEREAKFKEQLVVEINKELQKSGIESMDQSGNLINKLLREWVVNHRPFMIKNIWGYSMNYYRRKFIERVMPCFLTNDDGVAFSKVKKFLYDGVI
jgi:glycosyltransferase domain-containing protein